jgi:DNA ligase-1
MRRFRRVHDIRAAMEGIPLKLYLFDLLHVNGRTLLNEPYRRRWAELEALVPPERLASRRIVRTKEEIESFLKEALEAGHEGLMAKHLESTYTVGKRGKKWFKIKPADRLDCAIVAAEWGSGRREGWLSNYWLAVRDESTGDFQMIGKTFKGLTDAERLAMTERLQTLKTSEDEWTVHVRPEIVVEVAYNEIQRSPHYPSGFALRFARISRVRDDKGPGDADTYERLQALYEGQFERKGAAVREP